MRKMLKLWVEYKEINIFNYIMVLLSTIMMSTMKFENGSCATILLLIFTYISERHLHTSKK